MATNSPVFRKGLASIIKGDKLIAPIRSYLMDPKFPGFDVHVGGLGTRAPDGWFHPSEHPTWSPAALYTWLTNPAALIGELRDPTAVLAMTAGSIWHSIMEHVLTELNLVEGVEIPVEDAKRRTRGKMDGIMLGGEQVFELKTMKDNILRNIDSAETYCAKYPGYHAQANEYMRMSGLRFERVLLMSLTFPYDMREFVIEYDEVMGKRVADKYESVVQAVADGRMPMCDGCWNDSACPARFVCRERMGLK